MRTLHILALLALAGCCDTSYGPEESERGLVIQTLYHPDSTAHGTGISTRGDMVSVSTYQPATYGLVFQCEHGQFAVSGTNRRYRALWEGLPQGTEVTIYYRRVFEECGEGKVMKGFDFLNAEPTRAW